MAVKAVDIMKILKNISTVMDENKLFLSELDGAIGDGDHGLNMNKGFNAVVEKLEGSEEKNIGNLLKTAGMALVSNVGGASGPLYGTAFMKAGMKVNGKEEVDINDFAAMVEEALNGIKMRGKSDVEEKTMIDSIQPALNALKESIDKGLSSIEALENAVKAAESGVEHTKEIVATKGRASYLGERSIGHQDPGATSSYLIFKTIYENIK
ncbi:dihydroxyacetone kinase subunit DhaL [Clostridium ganghwense]|uniref:Dihydroxyacetone kinase subunit DhaL n=1 Tax=Clostridium ganghwense TaxID=312089 RepID=A0ABT4CPF3_9CLOT|nr:dihydroxyacetone kinase subunit DhaL [Clostridium ganghwense]MCY6370833.1 dihydroxyacetone kinase subunit DhaL [Clostridium ganghwense]